MGVKAIFFECRDVGKHFKKSKKHYLWKFDLDGRTHIIELFNSQLSGKKKVLVNGLVVCERQKFKGFQFQTTIEKALINLVQYGDKYELRINNQSFDYLYGSKKSQSTFVMDSTPSAPISSSRTEGWKDVKAAYAESGITSKQAKKGIDFEESKYDKSYKLTSAFAGLGGGADFGRREIEKPPSSGIDFKPTKKISLPREREQASFTASALAPPPKKEMQPASNDGWGDGSSGFNFEEYAASNTTTASSYAGGLPAPARSGLSKPPTSVAKPVSRPAPVPQRTEPVRQVQPAAVAAPISQPAPPPAPAPMMMNLLQEDDTPSMPAAGIAQPSQPPMSSNLLDGDDNPLTSVLAAVNFGGPIMQPDNVPEAGVNPQAKDVLSKLYQNTPAAAAAAQQPQTVDGGMNLLGGEEDQPQQPAQPQGPKDGLWGGNNLFNLDNIEDEDIKKPVAQPSGSAFAAVPMSEMNYEAKAVTNFQPNLNMPPPQQTPMNPVFGALGMNPFGQPQPQPHQQNPFMMNPSGGYPPQQMGGAQPPMMNQMGGAGMMGGAQMGGQFGAQMGGGAQFGAQMGGGQVGGQMQSGQFGAGGMQAGFGMETGGFGGAPAVQQPQGQNPFELF